jgi:hypothetical protein
MSTYPLCAVDGCKNTRSDFYDSEFRGTFCDPCMDAQCIIGGRNRREWAHEDSRAGYLGWGAAVLAVVLIFSFAGPVVGFLTIIATGVLCIALNQRRQS